jgi:hypothetical protein
VDRRRIHVPRRDPGFLAIGYIAFRELGRFVGARLQKGGFNCAANNSFAQMLPAFALSMIGVGLAAPAAMSTSPLVAGISLVLSTFFIVAAVLMALIVMVMSIRPMLENGVNVEAAPTLMVVIPLITVVGIALMRQNHGLHVHFDVHGGAGETLRMLTRSCRPGRLRPLRAGRSGPRRLPRPLRHRSRDVAGFLRAGLPRCGAVGDDALLAEQGPRRRRPRRKFSVAYWSISAVAVALQISMIVLVWMLASKHFRRTPTDRSFRPSDRREPEPKSCPPSIRGAVFSSRLQRFPSPQ